MEAGRGGARVSLVSLPREEAGSCSPPAESPLPGDVALSQLERATISRRFSVKPTFARWEQQVVRVVVRVVLPRTVTNTAIIAPPDYRLSPSVALSPGQAVSQAHGHFSYEGGRGVQPLITAYNVFLSLVSAQAEVGVGGPPAPARTPLLLPEISGAHREDQVTHCSE